MTNEPKREFNGTTNHLINPNPSHQSHFGRKHGCHRKCRISLAAMLAWGSASRTIALSCPAQQPAPASTPSEITNVELFHGSWMAAKIIKHPYERIDIPARKSLHPCPFRPFWIWGFPEKKSPEPKHSVRLFCKGVPVSNRQRSVFET